MTTGPIRHTKNDSFFGHVNSFFPIGPYRASSNQVFFLVCRKFSIFKFYKSILKKGNYASKSLSIFEVVVCRRYRKTGFQKKASFLNYFFSQLHVMVIEMANWFFSNNCLLHESSSPNTFFVYLVRNSETVAFFFIWLYHASLWQMRSKRCLWRYQWEENIK